MTATPFKSNFALPTPVPDPAPQRLCASDRPLVLLPIRIETRFFALAGGATELRVRVYPDKIHLDSHETDFRPVEVQAGQQYWIDDWTAGKDDDARATAWRRLADNFGVTRAAFIARSLTPTNPQDRGAPVAAGSPPLVPVFPAVRMATVDVAWRTAPQARLLPDRWIAILHSGNLPTTVVTGSNIPRTLNVGPDPAATDADIFGNGAVDAGTQLAADPGMKWMIDFIEAERVGMGFRIPISPAMLTAGLDTLYVFGICGTLDATTGASRLADLLDAHHYTDGLEFLRFGTPTNNSDDRRAALEEDDETRARSFAIEVNTDPASFDAGANAVRVGTALGVGAARIAPVLGHIAQADEHHELDMRSMNSALWPASWGYFLSNMLGPETAGLTPALIDWARSHFVTSVRAGGPFPVLRAGRQPYGILPVTSLDLWKPKAGEETLLANDVKLQSFLIKLRDAIWRPALPIVNRIGMRRTVPGNLDVDGDLGDVMSMDALASSYGTHSVFGPHYAAHLHAFFKADLNAKNYFGVLDGITNKGLQAAGLAVTPRLKRATYNAWGFPVLAPLVQAGEVSPWRKLEPNYIQNLLDFRTINEIVGARPDPANANAPKSLLQSLLRHSLLREIADTVARIASSGTGALPFTTLQRDAELVNLVRDPSDPNGLTVLKTETWKRQIDKPSSNVTGTQSIRTYLEGLIDYTSPVVAPLGDVRDALAHLKDLDSEQLQYLMQGTLDLASHRLDAWMTSFATKRLATMSANGPQGAYVGAYGWVENLIPLAGAPVTPPPGEQAPMFTLPNDTGFIHAPSATHASAAALLRNAQLGAANTPKPNGPFAVDLSSRRVREASRLLDGVREGQPLGALLGYRIERRLHERSLDHFIAALRSLAPIAPSTVTNGNGGAPAQTIAANNVVDGQLLFRRWQEEKATVISTLNGVTTNPTDLTDVQTELDRLGESIDGVSDALVAEAAYQMARGNNSRIAATLAAITKGDAPPPELEVARMPRTGTALTHRVLTLFSGTATQVAGWPAIAGSVRSQLEPNLNAWVSRLLGDPRKIRCTVERLDAATGAVVETQKFTLADAAIGPMDVVYGVEESAGVAPATSPNDLEQIVLYTAKHRTGGFAVDTSLRVQHARPTDLAAGELTLFDAMEQARAIRKLLASARAADPEDVNPPERASKSTIDNTELLSRVTRAEAALLSSNNQLSSAITRTASTSEELRTALLRIGTLGIGPAVPIVASGESPDVHAALIRQGKALLKISTARMAKGAELRTRADATDPRARRDQLVERYGVVFGQACIILPTFVFDTASGTEFKNALAASTQTQGGDALAVNTWFTRGARVRDAIARFGGVLRTAEVFGTGTRLDLRVAQLPLVAGERWVGLPPVGTTPLPPSKLSLVVHALPTLTTTGRVAGIVVDEWSEVVPNQKETTAITFQYNPPDACAPQSLLLAVPPVPGNDWTVELLHRVLMETLDLAKLRGVEPDLLGALAHYVPGLYLAFNAKDDAISTDFAPLTH